MERRGDFDFDIGSGLGTTGSGSAGLEMINSESDRSDTRAVVPFMSIINHYCCRTLVHVQLPATSPPFSDRVQL